MSFLRKSLGLLIFFWNVMDHFYFSFWSVQGELNGDHDMVDFIMNQPNVVPRINSRILTTSRNYLDLSATSESDSIHN